MRHHGDHNEVILSQDHERHTTTLACCLECVTLHHYALSNRPSSTITVGKVTRMFGLLVVTLFSLAFSETHAERQTPLVRTDSNFTADAPSIDQINLEKKLFVEETRLLQRVPATLEVSKEMHLLLHGVRVRFFPENTTVGNLLSSGDNVNTPAAVDDDESRKEQEDKEAETAILFPFFVLFIGACVYFVQTRIALKYFPPVPYVAFMFAIGTACGAAAANLPNLNDLNTSTHNVWVAVDPQVILLVFLPGLVTSDALSMDLTLFRAAFWQCLTMAFPMLIAVAALTATSVVYLFPYDWSWNFAMTLGSILAATDHASISALLSSVRAPPRLQIHVGGEALLNDAFAYIAFAVFWDNYLIDYIAPDENQVLERTTVTVEAVAIATVGSIGSGLLFGIGMLIVSWLFNRRLSGEENVVEVVMTLVAAYLCFFVTHVMWSGSGVVGSGVVATLTYGILLNAYGINLVNDTGLLKELWEVVEYVLITLLFALGGAVWGSIVFQYHPSEYHPEEWAFGGVDWGYLFALYLLTMVIRFVVFFLFYPMNKYLGLGTSVKETTFQSYSGLRGTIGIALALVARKMVSSNIDWFLDSEIEKVVKDTNELFGMVGGIALLTLSINGTFAGTVIKALRLTESTEIKEKTLKFVWKRVGQRVSAHISDLLAQRRFRFVDLSIVQSHVPFELHTRTPNRSQRGSDIVAYEYSVAGESESLPLISNSNESTNPATSQNPSDSEENSMSDWEATDLRLLFIKLVRAAYYRLVKHGELADRQYLMYTIERSLKLAEDAILQGEPIMDWEYLRRPSFNAIKSGRKWVCRKYHRASQPSCCRTKHRGPDVDYVEMRSQIEVTLAFLRAHRLARGQLTTRFFNGEGRDGLSEEEAEVLRESEEECAEAERFLESHPIDTLSSIVSHKVSKIALSSAVDHIEEFADSGLLNEHDVEHMFEEIEEMLHDIDSCDCVGAGESSDTADPEPV